MDEFPFKPIDEASPLTAGPTARPPAEPGPEVPARPPSAGPPTMAQHARGFVRFLYSKNPFYVVSAGLMLWGLYRSFDTVGAAARADGLMLWLTGYTVLLAAAAVFLVRVGKVWDDVRTILLVVVLMFLAISVTFDKTLGTEPELGMRYYLAGFAVAVLLSEGILWGLPLRLPVLFRLPYYLILAIFFLYPVAVSMLGRMDTPALRWSVFGFSPLTGLGFLTLLPAIRRGPRYVRDTCPARLDCRGHKLGVFRVWATASRLPPDRALYWSR